jgi:hypothetical protein
MPRGRLNDLRDTPWAERLAAPKSVNTAQIRSTPKRSAIARITSHRDGY